MDGCLLQWYVFFAIIFIIVFRIKTQRNTKAGKIPEKWLSCPPSGNFIVGKFLPFKTPLSENFNCNLLLQYRFPPKAVFDIAKQHNIKFGLWLDLTDTNKYYFKEDIAYYKCQYIKLSPNEFEEIPSRESVGGFINIVHEFICKYPDDYIAVHCTYGFNQTGFFIVSFLIEKLKYDLTKALRVFAGARSPGIYDKKFICELYKRYGTVKDTLQSPQVPNWDLDEKTRRPWRRLK